MKIINDKRSKKTNCVILVISELNLYLSMKIVTRRLSVERYIRCSKNKSYRLLCSGVCGGIPYVGVGTFMYSPESR